MKSVKAMKLAMLGTVVFTAAMVLTFYLAYDPGVKKNRLTDTLTTVFIAWTVAWLNMLLSRLAKDKNLRGHKIIIAISVVSTLVFGMGLPAFLTFRVFHTPQPYNDMISMALTGLVSLVVPALVLRMKPSRSSTRKASLQYDGRIWKCPVCGSLLEKPNNDTWKLVGGANVAGTATCAKCGTGTPIAEVYTGRYDV